MPSRIEHWLQSSQHRYVNPRTGSIDILALLHAGLKELHPDDDEIDELFTRVRLLQEHTLPTLREIRRKIGYSNHRVFAEKVGLAPSTIWLAENMRVIAKDSALTILTFLKEKHGMEYALDQIQWNVDW